MHVTGNVKHALSFTFWLWKFHEFIIALAVANIYDQNSLMNANLSAGPSETGSISAIVVSIIMESKLRYVMHKGLK